VPALLAPDPGDASEFTELTIWSVADTGLICCISLIHFNATVDWSGSPGNDLRDIFRGCQQMANVPNDVEKLWKISAA